MKQLRFWLLVLCAVIAASICRALPSGKVMTARSGLEAQITLPWDQPPPEFKELEKRGFHDGVQAAINDYNHHREPDPERRKEFRNPHVKRSFVEDYRKGFRRGYDDSMRHMVRSNGHRS